MVDIGEYRGGNKEQAIGCTQGVATGMPKKGWDRRWQGILQAVDDEWKLVKVKVDDGPRGVMSTAHRGGWG